MPQKIEDITVLIVESNAGMRTQIRNMLALCGISKVGLAVAAGVATRKLRENNYDIILCEYHLGEGQDGQHLLEDLRQHHLIPLTTLFLMITGESQYERVVSAAELAPNDYILKPFSSDKLLGRLSRALEKRDAFLPTYKLIEAGSTLEAIDACRLGETEHPQHLIDFLRLRAELHIAAGQADEAQQVYQLVVETKAVPWAKLGLAKTLYMQRSFGEAEEQLQALVAENNQYLDAYDWLAKTREATGRLEEAKETLQEAVRVSPHTVRRLRKLGEVATEVGDMETATKTLGEVVRKGKYSDFRDPEDHVSLVRAQLGMGDVAAANNTLRDLDRGMDNQPKAALCKAISSAMVATKTGDTEAANAALSEALRFNDPRLGASLQLKKELARICIENKQDDKAAGVIMDIMRHAADDHAVESIKNMLADLGRPELGENLAQRVRTEVRSIMTEGAQLAQSGDFDGSVRQMLQAVERLPGNTQVLFNASLALLKHIEHNGWNEHFARNAKDFIERVKRQDPGNERLSVMVNFFHALMKKNGVRPEQIR
ncbi:tetratricopeptide repeat-containing response regulator [Uliginosibacterium gangwonense]|uniref:tetratricopeptide repeat-containing response regulator n=1 Tax=Uliginosibacterium gangwonense TaxID=392736 RepID=UPI000362FD94|nr:tetratricopeptide repeat-containing response regulator [Uliginosibacterium gangwonense]